MCYIICITFDLKIIGEIKMDSFFFSEKTVEQQTAELVRILKANAGNKEVVDAISKQRRGQHFLYKRSPLSEKRSDRSN